MEYPEPARKHRELEKLAGHFAGPERMHPSYWNPKAKSAEAVSDAHVALDGFAVVQDYAQLLDDGSRFAGHGVFRYDAQSDTYEMHWFDSTGGPERIFRGGFADNMLVMTARVGDGWQRVTYDFNLEGGYRFRLETSDDGDRWNLALEGDNIQGRQIERRAPAKRKTARTKTAAGRSATRAGGTAKRKAAGRKTTAKKAAAKKTAARKVTAKKAPAKKATAKRATTKKAAAKKTAGKKTAARKTAAKKAAGRKPAARKATSKKAIAKTTARKAGARKTAAKKTAGKKTAAKKTAASSRPARKKAKARAKTRVAPIEKQRREGRASKKIGAKKSAARAGDGGSAMRSTISQKSTKGAAHKGPRMPTLKSTSTRVGWHKTAAKGVPEG